MQRIVGLLIPECTFKSNLTTICVIEYHAVCISTYNNYQVNPYTDYISVGVYEMLFLQNLNLTRKYDSLNSIISSSTYNTVWLLLWKKKFDINRMYSMLRIFIIYDN